MMFRPALRLAFLLTLAGSVLSCSKAPETAGPIPPAAAGKMGDLTQVTGPRQSRLVWLEQDQPEGLARRVFGYDAADGLGIRSLTPQPADYARPLFAVDGSTVVYTRLHATAQDGKFSYTPEILLQPWDGVPRSLGKGMAVAFWKDPVSGKPWIYAVETLLPGQVQRLTGEKLLRFHPDQPDEREIIWTATTLGTEQFQLSRDGRRAAGVFPFPKAGLADLTNQTFTSLAAGSWPAGASDDSYAAAVLDGSRRRLRFFAPNLDPGWELTFMGAPGWQDGGLLHPRWSSDPGVMVFTGPHQAEETTGDLSIVRFREDLRSIAQVARLTEGRKALSPDLWVEGGPSAVSNLPQQPVVVPKPEPKAWPSPVDELVFAWDHAKRSAPLPAAPARLTPQGLARWGRYSSMDLSDGWFEADPAAGAAVAAASAASSAWSMELILTERPAAPPVSVRLAALMLPDGREAFALYRVDRKLVLRILLGGTPERAARVHPVVLTNLAIEADRPVHLLLSLRNNRLSCWLDGQMRKDFQLESSGLSAWTAGSLTFGDPQPYGSVWSGTLDRVAVWSRALGDDEIREAADTALQWMSSRTRPNRYKIKAIPAEAPVPPSPLPDTLLDVRVWDVQQVLMGNLESRRIAVADWSRLQGQTVPPFLPEPGQPADLLLELWEDHPELEGVPAAHAPGANGLPLYFLSRPLRSPP